MKRNSGTILNRVKAAGKISAGILAALLFSSGVSAAGIHRRAGTASADILKLGACARSAAMGGAFTAVPGDLSGFNFNTAGAGFIDEPLVSFTHNYWIQDTVYNYAAGVYPFSFGNLGFNLRMFSMGDDIMETELDLGTFSPVPTGRTLSAYDTALGINYARDIRIPGFADRVSIGGSVNYLQRNLADYDASSVFGDLGVMWLLQLDGREYSAGVSVRNIGTPVDFGNDKERLPYEFRGGGSALFVFPGGHAVRPSLDIVRRADSRVTAKAGAEYDYLEMVYLRAGYRVSDNPHGNFSCGVGVTIKPFRIDYAWVPFGDIFGDTHRFTLTWRLREGLIRLFARARLDARVELRDMPRNLDRENMAVFTVSPSRESRGNIKDWEFRIESDDKREVFTISGEDDPPSRLYWDGDDNRGYPVPEGNYHYHMVLRNMDGEEFETTPDWFRVFYRTGIKTPEERMAALRESEDVDVTEEEETIEFRMASHLLFDFGEYEFDPDTAAVLPLIADALNIYSESEIIIEGHTDNIGDEEFNYELSRRRADFVRDTLVALYGVSPERIETKGRGPSRPIADNDTPEGRARNRRVEIIMRREPSE